MLVYDHKLNALFSVIISYLIDLKYVGQGMADIILDGIIFGKFHESFLVRFRFEKFV